MHTTPRQRSAASWLFEIVAPDEADEPAVRGRNEQARQVALAHALKQRVGADAGADGGRAGGHRLFDGFVRVGGEGLATKAAEHNLSLVDDDAGVPAGGAGTFANVGEPVGERARGYISVRNVSGQSVGDVRAFVR